MNTCSAHLHKIAMADDGPAEPTSSTLKRPHEESGLPNETDVNPEGSGDIGFCNTVTKKIKDSHMEPDNGKQFHCIFGFGML